jgi:hypothetical protein
MCPSWGAFSKARQGCVARGVPAEAAQVLREGRRVAWGCRRTLHFPPASRPGLRGARGRLWGGDYVAAPGDWPERVPASPRKALRQRLLRFLPQPRTALNAGVRSGTQDEAGTPPLRAAPGSPARLRLLTDR